ncbi:hypothetical protein EVAR_24160_1 [Eumeta japonica]|uniref:Uncharacterized protein n=1 Tax=Eumeta variegata TaxID=151549 RepID=A0A4C1W794_EUMVA|nr:hypothetical protein EVAR_24160_1 [Eumeta japonica]
MRRSLRASGCTLRRQTSPPAADNLRERLLFGHEECGSNKSSENLKHMDNAAAQRIKIRLRDSKSSRNLAARRRVRTPRAPRVALLVNCNYQVSRKGGRLETRARPCPRRPANPVQLKLSEINNGLPTWPAASARGARASRHPPSVAPPLTLRPPTGTFTLTFSLSNLLQ